MKTKTGDKIRLCYDGSRTLPRHFGQATLSREIYEVVVVSTALSGKKVILAERPDYYGKPYRVTSTKWIHA